MYSMSDLFAIVWLEFEKDELCVDVVTVDVGANLSVAFCQKALYRSSWLALLHECAYSKRKERVC